eukprot:RCo033142
MGSFLSTGVACSMREISSFTKARLLSIRMLLKALSWCWAHSRSIISSTAFATLLPAMDTNPPTELSSRRSMSRVYIDTTPSQLSRLGCSREYRKGLTWGANLFSTEVIFSTRTPCSSHTMTFGDSENFTGVPAATWPPFAGIPLDFIHCSLSRLNAARFFSSSLARTASCSSRRASARSRADRVFSFRANAAPQAPRSLLSILSSSAPFSTALSSKVTFEPVRLSPAEGELALFSTGESSMGTIGTMKLVLVLGGRMTVFREGSSSSSSSRMAAAAAEEYAVEEEGEAPELVFALRSAIADRITLRSARVFTPSTDFSACEFTVKRTRPSTRLVRKASEYFSAPIRPSQDKTSGTLHLSGFILWSHLQK